MIAQTPIPPEAYTVLAQYGLVAVADRRGTVHFVPADAAKKGVDNGWFTPAKPPSKPMF